MILRVHLFPLNSLKIKHDPYHLSLSRPKYDRFKITNRGGRTKDLPIGTAHIWQPREPVKD